MPVGYRAEGPGVLSTGPKLMDKEVFLMTMQELTPEEIDCVYGGKGGLGKAFTACVVGASAGSSTAGSGHALIGAASGCLAGAAVGMASGGAAAQTVAGWAAGAAHGPYGGSSNNPSAANHENSFDRMNDGRRMSVF